MRQEGELPEQLPKDKGVCLREADYKVSLVKISDIVHLESEGEYVRMHLADGTTITTLFRLKNMEAALPSDMFMRVHRSYIVNLHDQGSRPRPRIPQRYGIRPHRRKLQGEFPALHRISKFQNPAGEIRAEKSAGKRRLGNWKRCRK